jgi:hypothetical protein
MGEVSHSFSQTAVGASWFVKVSVKDNACDTGKD